MSRSIERTLEKIKGKIEEGSYYEAHQMYRTVFNRYRAQKKWDSCKRLLINGVNELCEKEQFESSLDLFNLLISTLEQSATPVNDSNVTPLFEILAKMPSSKAKKQKIEFLNAILRWSGKYGISNSGDPVIHYLIGKEMLSDNQKTAEDHLILGGELGARMLASLYHKEFSGDRILTKVLKYLSSNKMKSCKIFMRNIESERGQDFFKRVESQDGTLTVLLTDSSQFNFAQLLLICVQYRSAETFQSLRHRYESLIKLSEQQIKMLDEIGQIYFGLAPKASGFDFSSLLGSILNPNPSNISQKTMSPEVDLD